MICVKNVSFAIGQQAILDDINVDIPKGGVVALIGPNGAGKSTLLSLISRLTPVQTGQVFVDELRIGKCDNTALARRLAILPQHNSFSSRLTVRDLIGFGRFPHNRGRPTAQDHSMISDAIDLFHLGPLAHRFLESLSGGQRQKACVAMTYVQDTDYLLLDEPLNNLDIAAARGLMQVLRRMAQRDQKTIVIVLHDINFAAAYADHLIVMKAGRIIAQGAPHDLISQKLLHDVFETDAPVHLVEGVPVVLP